MGVVSHQVDETMNFDPQSGPFLIGLMGATATGKSSVVSRLVKLGAYPIDCDKVHSHVELPWRLTLGGV